MNEQRTSFADLFNRRPSAETTISCDLSALPSPEDHVRGTEELWSERSDLRKVEGGYALRFPGSMDYAERLLGFIEDERRCCPFLTFEIAFEPERRGIWLYVGGDERVESFLNEQFENCW